MSRQHIDVRHGFALPSILIASVVMMIVMLAAVQTVSSITASLQTQYLSMLTDEARESGVAKANACLAENSYIPQWSDASPLRPNTDCSGGAACSNDDSCFVLSNSNVQTTFSIGTAQVGENAYVLYEVDADANLLRTSTGTPWKGLTSSIRQEGQYKEAPRISGGAGWQEGGHIAVVETINNTLYAMGANDNGQINDAMNPVTIASPVEIPLPSGVSSVTKLTTSGQGASYICIVGSNQQAYCRGKSGGGNTGLQLPLVGWNRVAIPAGLNAYDVIVDGYGNDSACVLAGTISTVLQAYCFGNNVYGNLGMGSFAVEDYPITNPQLFVVPAGRSVKKLMIQNKQNCAVLDTGDLYCAGRNNEGQITGTSTNHATPIKYNLPSMGSVSRKAKDVLMQYHGSEARVAVLATDGSIWTSGWYGDGDLGNNTFTGSTGLGGTPSWFGAGSSYGTGGAIYYNNGSSGKCIDNDGNINANGNPVQIYSCNGTVAQRWLFADMGSGKTSIYHPSTGKCLDLPGNYTANGTDLTIYTCNGSNAQLWTIDKVNHRIYHSQSGKCVDLTNNDSTNGSRIQIWDCAAVGYAAQRWWGGKGTAPWQAMISGNNFLCGLRDDYFDVGDAWSGVWCAGDNTYGQLANVGPETSHGSQCQSYADIHNVNIGTAAANEEVDIAKLSSEWQYQYDSLMVITKSGKVFGAGRNEYGKLGNGTTGDALNDYRQCVSTEFQLPSGVTAVDMSTRDEYSTYVLGSDNRIYVAGRNNLGQLGDGTTTNRLTPVEMKLPREDYMF